MNQPSNSVNTEWQQARALLAAGKMQEAAVFLETAARALHPAACFNLGCLHRFKLIEDGDKKRGLALIEQAAELGHGAAYYELAVLELNKPDKEPDWHYANACLLKSAEQKFPTALRTLAIHWSRAEDKSLLQLGTQCLEHASEAGDVVSLALLMHRLRSGIGCTESRVRANAINTLLIQTDLPIKPPTTQTHPQFAQATTLTPLPALPMPKLQENFWQQSTELLSESPWVSISDNVLNQEESYLLQYIGGPHLKPSITAAPDGQLVHVQLRSSFDMVFFDMLEDITLLLIQRRMAAIVDTTPAYSEPLQLLRYEKGQEYRPHRDYLPPSLITPLQEGGPGQRESTVIIYLNDIESGGETEFIELDKKIAPKMGRVLAFKNLHTDGSPDTRTLHAGLPVKSGTKWIATMWIHQGVFRT